MRDLFEHFNAALLIYDEGLAKDDQALAGALWRVMLTCDTETLDIRRLRTLVHYVRRNIAYLDNVQYDDLLKENALIWHPLKESIKATEDHI
ncbi:ubiquinol-cytochrome c reductase complex chaperone CBP3-like [Tropilaelaps mercedesae]|uniref:Ubiquinol-cytochrome c reductase complex chaperone CBP3-like n=1 Tax=Tropilaelaps mercedesae TaxID=418985 RepID=A0A1V9XDK4_9ACAR|nr:ubiquinol-cytochrome c reductase complex chaperone CBP3-like [Tropilaelaps mercedesae]